MDYSESMRETILQLPKLDPRIPELAKQIMVRADNPYGQSPRHGDLSSRALWLYRWI